MPASNETLQYMHQMARTVGLRLREPDLEALPLWSAERWRKLALLVLELAPRLDGWQVLILGTDISGEAALAEIERGSGVIYDATVAAACLKLFREQGYVIPA